MFGDVFHGRHDAPRLAVLVAQQRDGGLAPHRPPRPVDIALLTAVKRELAADELDGKLSVLREVGRVDEISCGHVPQLFGTVADQFAKAWIGLLHVALQVGVADTNGHVVEDIAEPVLAGTHGGLCLLSLAHLFGERGRSLAHGELDAPRAPGHDEHKRPQHRGRHEAQH